MFLHELLAVGHGDRLGTDSFRRGRPDPGIEGDRVDQLVRRDLFQGFPDSVSHIVDGGHTARLLAAGVMFVIAHQDDIVREPALLIQMIVVIEIVRDIVIDRDIESLLMGLYTELPDKFDEVFTLFRGRLMAALRPASVVRKSV